ncbi:MAG: pentapeptide repeat-containing protein [Myxococcota bacterium]
MSFRVSLLVFLFAGLALATQAQASTYQTTRGSDRDIRCYLSLEAPDPPVAGCSRSGHHPYAGVNLGPGVEAVGIELASALLRSADLRGADLRGARLSSSYVGRSDLEGANLSGARLDGALFYGTNLEGANLRGAKLSGAVYLGRSTGSAIYDHTTDFSNAWWDSGGVACLLSDRCKVFDPVAAGWTMVPEPTAALLLSLGLLLLVICGRPRARVERAAGQRISEAAASSAASNRSTTRSRSPFSHT